MKCWRCWICRSSYGIIHDQDGDFSSSFGLVKVVPCILPFYPEISKVVKSSNLVVPWVWVSLCLISLLTLLKEIGLNSSFGLVQAKVIGFPGPNKLIYHRLE